jgi:hypothetical protein
MTELLDRLGKSPAPPWETAASALNRLQAARGKEARAAALDELAQVVREGASAGKSQERVWQELRELVQERTRTAAAETKRVLDTDGMVAVDQVQAMLRHLSLAVRDCVRDPELFRDGPQAILNAFEARMRRFLLPAPRED